MEIVFESLALALVASTPLLLVVQGELVVQRSGIINLGVEGMMLMAAMTSVIAARMSGSIAAGFAGGVVGALAVAALFGVFVVTLRADQIVAGTAINLLALGVTGFFYRALPLFASAVTPPRFDIMVPLAWIVFPIAGWLLLWRSSGGLTLRACGENPDAVTGAGMSVSVRRWAALGVEGVVTGLAGAHLALLLSSGFAENMTAGRGYIALAIVIFGRWKFRGAVLGAAIFGATSALQYALQAENSGLPFHLLLALPYVITLLILGGIAGRVQAPAALGRS